MTLRRVPRRKRINKEKEAEAAVEWVLIANRGEEYRAKADSTGNFVLQGQREGSVFAGTIGRFRPVAE